MSFAIKRVKVFVFGTPNHYDATIDVSICFMYEVVKYMGRHMIS